MLGLSYSQVHKMKNTFIWLYKDILEVKYFDFSPRQQLFSLSSMWKALVYDFNHHSPSERITASLPKPVQACIPATRSTELCFYAEAATKDFPKSCCELRDLLPAQRAAEGCHRSQDGNVQPMGTKIWDFALFFSHLSRPICTRQTHLTSNGPNRLQKKHFKYSS